MIKRHRAQRQHIVHSLDTLLFQLFVLSFFLSPSLWALCMRIIWQFQCSRPRELDSNRSLRFFYVVTLFFNSSSLWNHFTQGAAEGRAVVLDFVGMSYTPSRLQLVALDVSIIFLQLLLTSIAYELSLGDESGVDTPAPIPSVSSPSPVPNSASAFLPFSSAEGSKRGSSPGIESPYILDISISLVLARLRASAPPPRSGSAEHGLPLPTTSPWPLPARFQMLMQNGRGVRGRNTSPERTSGTTRIPGTLEEEQSST